MSNYYKRIKGKNYDKKLIDLADDATSGKGDGRISLNDAKGLLRAVKDGGTYSDIEKRTMQYIRDKYKFTPEANQWFRKEIRQWAATKKKAVGKGGKAAGATAAAVGMAAGHDDVPAALRDNPSGYEPSPVLMKDREASAEQRRAVMKTGLIVLIVLLLIAGCYFLFSEYGTTIREKLAGLMNGGSSSQTAVDQNKKGEKTSADKTENRSEGKDPATVDENKKATSLNAEQIEGTRLFFKRGSSRLSKDAKKELNQIADFLKTNSHVSLVIMGHTCDLGGKKTNAALSRSRAKSAYKYLEKKGVKKKRMSVQSFSNSRPLMQGSSDEARAKNRRVEFQLKE